MSYCNITSCCIDIAANRWINTIHLNGGRLIKCLDDI